MYTAPPEHVTYVYTRPLHHALPIPVGAQAGPVAGDGVDDAVDAGERLPGLGLVAEVAERHPPPLRQPTAVGGAGLEAPLPLLVERSEEHTSELQSLMRNSYAVLCLKTKKTKYSYFTTNLSHI